MNLEVSEVRYGDYAVDSLMAALQSNDKNVTLRELVLRRGTNQVTARGRYELPQNLVLAATQPGAIELHVAAPKIEEFWVEGATPPVTGAVQLYAQTDLGAKLGGGVFQSLRDRSQGAEV